MKNSVEKTRKEWAAIDAVRDAGLTTPDDITRFDDISYGEYGDWNTLDVYCPKGTASPLPTIISIHGGAWFYGSKQLYSHYCMRMAQRGFTVVNFNYRLAPEFKYPAPLEDICSVLHWVQENADAYFIDLKNIFLVGDSAGGQLCQQICTFLTNPEYAKFFNFSAPENFKVNACALNCGCYFIPISRVISPKMMGYIFDSYFPEDYLHCCEHMRVRKYVTNAFPPAFVMTAKNDYLRMMARPMYNILRKNGIESVLRIYGSKKQKEIAHVFHLNCRFEIAAKCNDEQAQFFRKHIV